MGLREEENGEMRPEIETGRITKPGPFRSAIPCPGLPNFLRPFPGASKWYLHKYVGILKWMYTLKEVTADSRRALFGVRLTTNLGL